MMMWVELLGTGAAATLAGAGVSAVFGRRKIASEIRVSDASSAEVIATAATNLILPLNAQIERMTTCIDQLKSENELLKAEIAELRDLIREMRG